MNSDFVLVSRWRVACDREALWDELEALLDTSDPMRWWPPVEVEAYDGDRLDLRVRSGLGYSVRFRLDDLHTRRPDRLTFTATGDLRGRGEVAFSPQAGGRTLMRIDWRVATRRPWMRRTAWLLRPVFVVGHHLVMRRGQRHLARWLDARRG